jgi:hypothetical protein
MVSSDYSVKILDPQLGQQASSQSNDVSASMRVPELPIKVS